MLKRKSPYVFRRMENPSRAAVPMLVASARAYIAVLNKLIVKRAKTKPESMKAG